MSRIFSQRQFSNQHFSSQRNFSSFFTGVLADLFFSFATILILDFGSIDQRRFGSEKVNWFFRYLFRLVLFCVFFTLQHNEIGKNWDLHIIWFEVMLVETPLSFEKKNTHFLTIYVTCIAQRFWWVIVFSVKFWSLLIVWPVIWIIQVLIWKFFCITLG